MRHWAKPSFISPNAIMQSLSRSREEARFQVLSITAWQQLLQTLHKACLCFRTGKYKAQISSRVLKPNLSHNSRLPIFSNLPPWPQSTAWQCPDRHMCFGAAEGTMPQPKYPKAKASRQSAQLLWPACVRLSWWWEIWRQPCNNRNLRAVLGRTN